MNNIILLAYSVFGSIFSFFIIKSSNLEHVNLILITMYWCLLYESHTIFFDNYFIENRVKILVISNLNIIIFAVNTLIVGFLTGPKSFTDFLIFISSIFSTIFVNILRSYLRNNCKNSLFIIINTSRAIFTASIYFFSKSIFLYLFSQALLPIIMIFLGYRVAYRSVANEKYTEIVSGYIYSVIGASRVAIPMHFLIQVDGLINGLKFLISNSVYSYLIQLFDIHLYSNKKNKVIKLIYFLIFIFILFSALYFINYNLNTKNYNYFNRFQELTNQLFDFKILIFLTFSAFLGYKQIKFYAAQRYELSIALSLFNCIFWIIFFIS